MTTNYIKLMFIPFFVALALNCGCDKPAPAVPGPEEPDDGDGDETEIRVEGNLTPFADFKSAIGRGETLQIPLEGPWVLPVAGFEKGNTITVSLRYDSSVTWTFTCTETSAQTGATFTIPDDFPFIGGMCNVAVVSSSGSVSAETFVEVTDDFEVERKAGYTAYGRVIDYNGNPIAGVAVSDGVLVTTTDSEGRYYLRSQRYEGFVFISVPKNYRVAVNRSIPQFFRRFETASSTYEMHNFVLAPEDNTKHRVLVFTDTHVANRKGNSGGTEDLHQYETFFIPDMEEQFAQARSENVPVYGLGLGDMSWDEWWYTNNYSIKDYAQTMSQLDIPIYTIPGNHDNDPTVSGDFEASQAWRDNMGPTYFSMNIGDIHYIMMDNTLFHNTGGNNVQDYDCGFTDNQLNWLTADLATVPAGSTIVFGMHISVTRRPNVSGNFEYFMPSAYRARLLSLLSGYNVHFVTGHNHINFTNKISDSMTEHNIASVSGTQWWTGYYTNDNCRICQDGTPSGYKVFDISGTDIRWHYKSLARHKQYQFRAYDLRNCLMTRALYCPTSKTNVSDAWFSQYANGWDKAENTSSTTKILVNVFDWNEDWNIEIIENGNSLTVTRVEKYDPLHTIHFNMSRMCTGTYGTGNVGSQTFPTGLSTHFFEATASGTASSILIRATDSFGNVYEETMTRPRLLYNMSTAVNTW